MKNKQCKRLVLGIGNHLRSDDMAGSVIAQRLSNMGVCSIDAEFMPENFIGVIKRKDVQKLIIVDACDVALSPGEVRIIDISKIHSGIVATHSMPFGILLQKLKEITANITFIGIQPENVAVGDVLSVSVQKSIDYIIELIITENEETIARL